MIGWPRFLWSLASLEAVGCSRSLLPLASLEVVGLPRFLKSLASLEFIGWPKFLWALASLEAIGRSRSLEPLAALEVVGWPGFIKPLAALEMKVKQDSFRILLPSRRFIDQDILGFSLRRAYRVTKIFFGLSLRSRWFVDPILCPRLIKFLIQTFRPFCDFSPLVTCIKSLALLEMISWARFFKHLALLKVVGWHRFL